MRLVVLFLYYDDDDAALRVICQQNNTQKPDTQTSHDYNAYVGTGTLAPGKSIRNYELLKIFLKLKKQILFKTCAAYSS